MNRHWNRQACRGVLVMALASVAVAAGYFGGMGGWFGILAAILMMGAISVGATWLHVAATESDHPVLRGLEHFRACLANDDTLSN